MEFNVLKIKGLIFQQKTTQDDFADNIGVTRQTLANYLSGRTKIDTILLGKICDYFDVNPNYFYIDAPEEEPLIKPRKKYLEQRIDELEERIKKLEKAVK